jgi:hypothetical protein
MNPALPDTPVRYCARSFSVPEIKRIRALIDSQPPLNRAALSRRVCQELAWLKPDGRSKQMSCRVAMLRMERDGLIRLPPPERANGNGRRRPALSLASEPRPPISVPAGRLDPLRLQPVDSPQDSALWNELTERYHYLGYSPLPGAQMRYLLFGGQQLLGLLGFGAAAWTVAPRDQFIGWSPQERIRNLHLVANNARFLILPWVTSRNLASRILGAAARQLPRDWTDRYGHAPVLLETFVERERFRGTSYRAANWIYLGSTQGRGKLDTNRRYPLSVKSIFVYPLSADFRQTLRTAVTPLPHPRVH